MRYVLLCIVGLLCTFLGIRSGDKLKLRSKALEAIVENLREIDEKINLAIHLSTAVLSKGFLANFWKALSDEISSGVPPDHAFDTALPHIDKYFLKEEDIVMLKNCISTLGKSNRKSQHECLSYYIEIFSRLRDCAQNDWVKKSKLQTTLGILCGFAIIIILI